MSYQIPEDKIGPALNFAQAHHLNLNDLTALIGYYVELLDGSGRRDIPPTGPSVIRANGNGKLFFGPDVADQWVTLDGEWWVGCDLTDIRVLWTLESV